MARKTWTLAPMALVTTALLTGCGGSNEQLVAFERDGDGFREITVEEALRRQGRTVPPGQSARDAVERDL